MDLSTLENQPTLDDAYNVVEQLLGYIVPNAFDRLPRDSTDINYGITRLGGYIEIVGDGKANIFYPLQNDLWLLRRSEITSDGRVETYSYIINDNEIVGWIVSSSKMPNSVNVRLSGEGRTLRIWKKALFTRVY